MDVPPQTKLPAFEKGELSGSSCAGVGDRRLLLGETGRTVCTTFCDCPNATCSCGAETVCATGCENGTVKLGSDCAVGSTTCFADKLARNCCISHCSTAVFS